MPENKSPVAELIQRPVGDKIQNDTRIFNVRLRTITRVRKGRLAGKKLKQESRAVAGKPCHALQISNDTESALSLFCLILLLHGRSHGRKDTIEKISNDFHETFTKVCHKKPHIDSRGVAMGAKSVQVDFLWGKMTSKRLLNMCIKFYTSPKNFIPPKQISGYAPDRQADRQTDRRLATAIPRSA